MIASLTVEVLTFPYIAYAMRLGRASRRRQAFAVQPDAWLPVARVTPEPARVSWWAAVAVDGDRQVWVFPGGADEAPDDAPGVPT